MQNLRRFTGLERPFFSKHKAPKSMGGAGRSIQSVDPVSQSRQSIPSVELELHAQLTVIVHRARVLKTKGLVKRPGMALGLAV
jgi:hypothetical protein